MWRKQPVEKLDNKEKSPEAVNGKAVAQASGESDSAVAVTLVNLLHIEVLSRSVCVRLFYCLCIYKLSENTLYACARSVLHCAGRGEVPCIKLFRKNE
jgi:hypothetical protein